MSKKKEPYNIWGKTLSGKRTKSQKKGKKSNLKTMEGMRDKTKYLLKDTAILK